MHSLRKRHRLKIAVEARAGETVRRAIFPKMAQPLGDLPLLSPFLPPDEIALATYRSPSRSGPSTAGPVSS